MTILGFLSSILLRSAFKRGCVGCSYFLGVMPMGVSTAGLCWDCREELDGTPLRALFGMIEL